MNERIGIVGVGQMGAAMAGAILGRGYALSVFDTRSEACAPLAERGARIAPSPRALAAECDLVAVVVLNDEQVRAVFLDEDGLLAAPGARCCVAIHSTVHVETVEEVVARAAAVGVGVVDAGVTGSVLAAEQGELATMVGGAPEVIDRCRPMLDCYSGLVCAMGGTGAGMRAKIARQAISFLRVAALHEGMRLAEAAGVDLAELARIVAHSDKFNRIEDILWLRGTAGPADPSTELGRRLREAAVYTTGIAEKDLGVARDLGGMLDLALPLTDTALPLMPAVFGVPEED